MIAGTSCTKTPLLVIQRRLRVRPLLLTFGDIPGSAVDRQDEDAPLPLYGPGAAAAHFERFDKNMDGRLDLAEVYDLLKSLSTHPVTDQEITRMVDEFGKWDTDGSGYIAGFDVLW